MKDRIGSIDGWRAIAALGVLLGHIIGALNYPVFKILGIDVFKLTQLWGHGVQLFFVISGLCFFLVLDNKNALSVGNATNFWKQRWLRIAPAFYFSCVIYAFFYSHISIPYYKAILYNFLFIQTYVKGAEISPHFWSLSVEWIFYLCLPFLFLLIKKFEIRKVVFLIIGLGLLFNLFHFKYNLYFKENWYYTFFANFEHFGWGLLIGYFYKYKSAKKIFNSYVFFILGLIIAYSGKLMFYSAFVYAAGDFGFIFQSLGPLVMSLGFAIMLLVSLNNQLISKIVGNRFFKFIGKISYSFYLWHVLVLAMLIKFQPIIFKENGFGVLELFLFSIVILLPTSYLSYRIFESFYFKRKNIPKPIDA